MKDGKVALSVVKNGKVENPAFEVDGLSGATFTSVGVSKMLQSILTSYSSFLSKSPAQPVRQPEASVAESDEAESNN